MEELAEKLGMDPLELKLKNYVGLGDTFWGQGPMVRSIVRSDGVPEMLRRGAELIGWHRRQPSGSQSGRYRRGIGMARGFHTSSAGAPKPGDVIDFSGAMVKINPDGSVDVVSAVVDHGGGTLEAMAKLVAETLCVPLDKVNVAPAETASTLYDVCTHATRGVYAGGGAAVRVAQMVRKELLETAAGYLGVYPEALELKLDEEAGEGVSALCRMGAARAQEEESAGAAAGQADLGQLTAMLAAKWKQGRAPRARAAALRAGEVRSFRITALDPGRRSIEVELAN
jgi:xanthine dehydrogenase molybdenum-binding subunit